MKVRELIEKLQKCDSEREVIIKFALDSEDEIGYVLIPKIVEQIFGDEVCIYSNYEITKDDCNFVGQVDLKEAYKRFKRGTMTEEEQKAIEELKSTTNIFNYVTAFEKDYLIESIKIVLNLIQKQQEEIEKLRNKNKDLLRKLRNRVKEVNKLTKYSAYKKEFSRLNNQLKKKDKIIDDMAEELNNQFLHYEPCWLDNEVECGNYTNCNDCIKQYFEKKFEKKVEGNE